MAVTLGNLKSPLLDENRSDDNIVICPVKVVQVVGDMVKIEVNPPHPEARGNGPTLIMKSVGELNPVAVTTTTRSPGEITRDNRCVHKVACACVVGVATVIAYIVAKTIESYS